MAYRKKSNVGAVVGGTIAFILLLGLVGGIAYKSEGFRNWDVKNWFNNQTSEKTDDEKSDSSSLSTEINGQNMAVRMLSKTITQEGYESLTYSFTITPANATRTEVQGTLSFVDGSEGVGNYLEFEIDNDLQTFTVTKKADFNKQAKLELVCVSANNVKATVTIDCKQQFLGFNAVSEKVYSQLLTIDDSIVVNDIKNDLAHVVGADNLSSVYTVPLNQQYTITNVSYVLNGYMMGDTIGAMVDSGLTLTNNHAIKTVDLSEDFTLAKLQAAVSTDAASMTESQRQLFEGKELFGIGYDMQVTYQMMGVSKVATAHLLGVADTEDLNFGVVPTGINVEDDSIVFNDDEEQSTTAIANFEITTDPGNGKGVFVSGEFNNWAVSTDYRLTWNTGNIWTGEFELIKGTYEYKFVVADYDTGSNADYDSLNGQNRTIVVE